MQRDLQISSLLILAVVGVYWPVYAFDFVKLDDYQYVYANRYVADGFTGPNIAHAMTGVTQGNWHPLTMLSHMLDCQLFGVGRPGMHHVMNLALHVANTLLVFRLFCVMTAARWRSAIVAALFGLHPLHVESVAWISERKDLLSTFFFLLTLLAYCRYAERPNLLPYMLVFTLLLLGLLSKPMLVTAPFVMLLLDFWPLRRWQPLADEPETGLKIFDGGDADPDESDEEEEYEDDEDEPEISPALLSQTPPLPQRTWQSLIVEKLPLFALSIVFSAIAYKVQQSSGAMDMLGQKLPLFVRLENAITAYGSYLSKTIFPTPLAAIYPYILPKVIDTVIIGASLLALLIASLRMARQRPYLIVGLLWFLGTLVPVIGLVQIGVQSTADRYTYIPLIGIFVVIAWGGAEFVAPWTATQRAASAVLMLAAFSVVSFLHLKTWHDSEALFRQAASVPQNYIAHEYLGLTLWDNGNLLEVRDEFNESLKIQVSAKIQPSEPTLRKLGLVLGILGKYDDARKALLAAIQIQPKQPEPYRHLAWFMATVPDPSMRDGTKAIGLAKRAIELDKSDDPLNAALNRDTLAAAFAEAGEFAEAASAARSAIEAAQAAKDPGLAAEIAARGQLYQNHKPYHASLTRPRRI